MTLDFNNIAKALSEGADIDLKYHGGTFAVVLRGGDEDQGFSREEGYGPTVLIALLELNAKLDK